MNDSQLELINRLKQFNPSFDLESLLKQEVERQERVNTLPVRFIEILTSSYTGTMKISIHMKEKGADVRFSLSIYDPISSQSLNKILNALYPIGVIIENSGFSYNIASIHGVLRSVTLADIQESLPSISTERKTVHTDGIDSNKILSVHIQKY